MQEKYAHDLLFADNAAIKTHTQEDLLWLLDCFFDACRHFGLNISLIKIHVMVLDVMEPPTLFIHD